MQELNFFWWFWKGYLATKKLKIALPYGFNLFFGRLFFHFSFQWPIHFLLKHFCNNRMVRIHIFFNVVIMFVILYKIKPCLNVIITKHNWATITKKTFHGLSLQGISHLHVCYYSHKKEVQHKCFLPFDFQIVLWACNLIMFSFIVFIFWILVFFMFKD